MHSHYNADPAPVPFAGMPPQLQGFGGLSQSHLGCGSIGQALQNALTQAQPQANRPPMNEIPSVVIQLFERTEHLADRLARHRIRLEPVLRCVPTDGPCEANGKGSGAATGLGDRLAQILARVIRAVDEIDTLDALLEL